MENEEKIDSTKEKPLLTAVDLINSAIDTMTKNAEAMDFNAKEIRKNIDSLIALRACIGNNTPLNDDARRALKGLLRNLLS